MLIIKKLQKSLKTLIPFYRDEKELNSTQTKDQSRLIALGIVCGISILALAIEKNRVDLIEKQTIEELNLKLSSVANRVRDWDKMNSLALSNLVSQPDIISMDPNKQKRVLENFVKTYKHLYLAHTVDLTGYNVGRSDSNKPKSYANRNWFAGVKLGNKINRQTVIGFSNNKPALCVGAPINQEEKLVGAATICTDLSNLSKQIGKNSFGKTGTIVVVDEVGKMLVHPNSAFLSGKELTNFSNYPPVRNLLEGRTEKFYFTDDNQQKWISLGTHLENGWGVLILITEKELLPNSNYHLIIYLAIGLIIIIFLFGIVERSDSEKQEQNIQQESAAKNINPESKSYKRVNIVRKQRPFSLLLSKNNLTTTSTKPNSGKRRCILIVDNNERNQQYFTMILESLGFKVVSTTNGESGYNIASNQLFDLILVNILLPISSVKTMIYKLRKLPAYSETPIIGVSEKIKGININQNRLKEFSNFLKEFEDFLEDPFNKTQLISLMYKHLNLDTQNSSSNIII